MNSKLNLQIEGMTCSSCVRRVENALLATDAVLEASVNLATEKASVSLKPGANIQAVIASVEKAGYQVATKTWTLTVADMSCASCVGRVEKAFKAVSGVLDASVNLATEKAQVTALAEVELISLLAAAKKAGYVARLVEDKFSIHTSPRAGLSGLVGSDRDCVEFAVDGADVIGDGGN